MSAFRFRLAMAAGLLMAAPAAVTAQSQTQTQTRSGQGQATGVQPPEPATPEETKALEGMKSEQRVMVEAYMGNLAEVAFGQLAQQKGQSQAAKDFGQKLIDDHSKANSTVAKYLDDQQVQHPPHVSMAALDIFTKLSEVSDQEFDVAFGRELAKEHENEIARYQTWMKTAKQDDVKNYLKDTLPVLQEHLKMAKDLQKGMRGGKA